MIQSCTFISWMKVITAYREGGSYTPTPGLQWLQTLLSCLDECENSRVCDRSTLWALSSRLDDDFQACSTLLSFRETAEALKLVRDSQLTYLFIP